ncbi:MAG: hypothetical protein ACRDJP_14900 [Actinomycetota bacterium]
MRRSEAAGLVVVGVAVTLGVVVATVGSAENRLMVAALLLIGPSWALAFCVASDDSDFSGGSRSRGQWLELLPWTFLMAPLIVPNLIVLASFFRDSRADGGRSPLTWDRMRPGDDDKTTRS